MTPGLHNSFPSPLPPRAAWLFPARVLALLAGLLGAASLTGWLLDISWLAGILPGWARINFNTAICLLLFGIALGLLPFRAEAQIAERTRAVVWVCVILAGVLVVPTLLEYATGRVFGVDNWLLSAAKDTGDSGQRMSDIVALHFLAMGIAVLFLLSRSRSGILFSRVLGIAAVTIPALALFLFVVMYVSRDAWRTARPQAVGATLGLALLAAAILSARRQEVVAEQRMLVRKLVLGFGFSALLIIFVSVVSLLSIRELLRSAGQVQHTLAVIETVASLETALANSISARRGHGLTKHEMFAERFEASVAQAESALKRLAELVADNPQQTARVQAITPMIRDRLARRRELIALKKQGRLPASEEPEIVAEGQAMADEVKAALEQVRAEENRLLADRKEAEEKAGQRTLLLIVLAVLLTFALLIPAARGIWVEFRARAAAESRLREQTELLGLILESLSDGVAVADTRGKFLVFNRAGQNLVGQPALDLPPSEWSRAYGNFVPGSNEPFPTERLPLVRALQGEDVDEELIEIRQPGGERRALLRVSGRPLRGAQGEVRGGVVIFRDVQAQHRAEQEIRRLNEELEARVAQRTAELEQTAEDLRRSEATVRRMNEELEERVRLRTQELEQVNKELEAFTYSTSHDLRAPLRHITGFSRILAEDHGPQMPMEARHLLARIEQGGRNMGRLIDDLLHLSRMGRQALLKVDVEMDALVAEARDEVMRSANGRQIEWRAEPLGRAQCDPVLMKQVFLNLLSNAVKFTAKQGRAEISVGKREQDGQPVYFVRDNGVGFSMKNAKKLFGVFQRLHRQEEFEGTGVGLAIVQRVILRHGGRLWAEAEPDRGATFFFTLVTPRPASPEVAREAHSNPGGSPS